MQISAISNTNFGKIFLEDVSIQDNVSLNHQDVVRLHEIVDTLNDCEAKSISAYINIGKPQVMNGVLSARIETAPTKMDMLKISAIRPGAKRHDYKRRSLWVPLNDNSLIRKFAIFLHKQKAYIHHCKKDPNHNAEPFDNPQWKISSQNPDSFVPRRKFVVKK